MLIRENKVFSEWLKQQGDRLTFRSIETFLCIKELKATNADHIFTVIDKELNKYNLNYSCLISCSFDGAANFSGI